MDTEMDTKTSAITNATAASNEEKTELEVHDNVVVLEGASTADQHAEQPKEMATEIAATEEAATEKAATEITRELNDEERKSIADEKKRAARKERVKKAINIRFTLGESDHTIKKEQAKKIVHEAPSSDNFIVALSDSSSSHAITTPTQLLRDIISTTELQEICINEIITEEDIERLLIEDSADDDDDEDIAQEPITGVDSVKAKTDFLDNFDIPSINDLSEGTSSESLEHFEKKVSELVPILQDPGKFVDPLTGERISGSETSSSSSSSSTSSSSSSKPNLPISAMSEDFLKLGSSTDMMLDSDNLMSIRIEFKDDDEHIFPEFDTNFSISRSPTAYDTWDRRPSDRIVRDGKLVTLEFLNDIIKSVVDAVENRKDEDIFNIRCDKLKLYRKLQEKVNQYNSEKDLRDYLTNKVLEHYRRMRNHRAYATLPTDVHEREYERYMDSLKRFDFGLIAAAEAKRKNAFLISSVQMDLSYALSMSYYSELRLSKKILAILGHKSDYITRIAERELRLMSAKRNEISDTRLSLILAQHTLARIGEKIRKLQHIKDDVSLDDYLAIQNQNGQLEKKIEERNLDLKRIRDQYHADLHINQHCRERSHAILVMLKEQHLKLQDALSTQQQLREKLTKAKVERQRIRSQHSDLSYQGGLLGVPLLMHDYDATVDKINAKRIVVNDMRATVTRLTQKISELEANSRAST